MSVAKISDPPAYCKLCPRLVSYRQEINTKNPNWFNGAVPSFGPSDATLLIVGLAPGVNGANRTSRPFTGDFAGDLLYKTLAKFGFSNGTYDRRADDGLELNFKTKPEHQAFPGVVNGGIIGTLFDCHGNWAAAIALLDAGHFDSIPSTVTAAYSVKLLRPPPFGVSLYVKAVVKELQLNKADVVMDLYADDLHCAQGTGLFVAVDEGHPAYHRW